MASQFPPSVVVYVNGVCADGTTAGSEMSCRDISGDHSIKDTHLRHALPLARRRSAVDAHKVMRCFLDRWSAFIRAHYRETADIMTDFSVSDRTARNWWVGQTGAVGGHVAVAMMLHPEGARKMLLAEGQ